MSNGKVNGTVRLTDLTPEQDLRAAITDMLANADHFGQCGDMAALAADVGVHRGWGDCVCLIGRLNWAINAEQVTTPTDPTAAAIDTLARQIIGVIVTLDDFGGDWWENVPDIGAHDFQAITDRVKATIEQTSPAPDQFEAAYLHLAKRCDAGDEA